MSVKLIWITPNCEQLIAYIARVSSNNQENPEYGKLIKYLVKNNHWSPFEMGNMCIEITTTRAISQQILRHRSFSFQEFSQRYKEINNINIPELRNKHIINRQSSLDIHEKNEYYQDKINKLYNDINNLYNEMKEDNIALECARNILPLSTETKIYMNGNIRSWIHYLQIRTEEHTQKEHREIAFKILDIFSQQLPTIYKAIFN